MPWFSPPLCATARFAHNFFLSCSGNPCLRIGTSATFNCTGKFSRGFDRFLVVDPTISNHKIDLRGEVTDSNNEPWYLNQDPVGDYEVIVDTSACAIVGTPRMLRNTEPQDWVDSQPFKHKWSSVWLRSDANMLTQSGGGWSPTNIQFTLVADYTWTFVGQIKAWPMEYKITNQSSG